MTTQIVDLSDQDPEDVEKFKQELFKAAAESEAVRKEWEEKPMNVWTSDK